MKRLLLLCFYTFFTSKVLCCEYILSPTHDPSQSEDSTSMYDLLTNLARQSKELETPDGIEKNDDFRKFKYFCTIKSHEFEQLQDSHGNKALHILLNTAITLYAQGVCGSEVQRTVDQWFPFPVFKELIRYEINPEEPYEWYNPNTGKKEQKTSLFSLLEKHENKPGVLQILEKTKVLAAAEKKEMDIWKTMATYWIE